MNKDLTRSIKITYLIGGTIGAVVILITFLLPFLFTGEPMMVLAFLKIHSYSLLGFIIAFYISLWFGAKLIYNNLLQGKSVLITSIKYSTLINSVVWVVFGFLLCFQTEHYLSIIIMVIILFIICVFITPFTIGLLIVSVIKRKLLLKNNAIV